MAVETVDSAAPDWELSMDKSENSAVVTSSMFQGHDKISALWVLTAEDTSSSLIASSGRDLKLRARNNLGVAGTYIGISSSPCNLQIWRTTGSKAVVRSRRHRAETSPSAARSRSF